jgi:hypothetical protein
MNQSEYNRILDSYNVSHSISATAEAAGVSTVKVRRVLITEGIWESPTSREVGRLYQEGKSAGEIANIMHTSLGNVQAYLPYSRGLYNEDPSDAAVRSKEYRSRMKSAHKQQDQKKTSSSTSVSKGKISTKTRTDHSPYEMDRDTDTDATSADIFADNSSVLSPDKRNNAEPPYFPAALQLHLELQGLEYLDDHEIQVLKQYGKMSESISRDIIVPATMTLRALHYCIQRLFSWQNSHLHHFSLMDEDLAEMTGGKASEYLALCGIYFRFSEGEGEDLEDVYWDDDYDGQESFARWEKKKYCGPYEYNGTGDHFLPNMVNVGLFRQDNPEVKDMTLEEAQFQYPDWNWNWLLERLPVGSLLGAEGLHCDTFLEKANQRLIPIKADPYSILLMQEINHAKELMKKMKEAQKKDTHTFPAKQYKKFMDAASLYQNQLESLQLANMNPDPFPVTNTLRYEYDYGDGWEVKISCTKLFQISSAGSNDIKQVIFQEAAENDYDEDQVRKIFRNEKPVCITADGHSLMDDVGGLHGYVSFLEHLYAPKNSIIEDRFTDAYNDSPAALKRWAKCVGWREKMPETKNML